MAVVSMSYLLEAGVHFGHQTKRWNPKMKEYIYTSRDEIYIIDLAKSAAKIEEAYNALKEIAANGGKVLFVGTRKQAQEAIKDEATRSGSFYVTERWLGGTLTNFRTIRKRVKRLEEIEKMEENGTFDLLPKKEVIKLKKEYDKLNLLLCGIREMYKLPDALYIVDPSKEDIAIKEARKLGIPVFGIVDTNCDPDMVDYVIPGNDDAIRAVKLITAVMANAIVEANGGELVDFVTEDESKKNAKVEDIMQKAVDSVKRKEDRRGGRFNRNNDRRGGFRKPFNRFNNNNNKDGRTDNRENNNGNNNNNFKRNVKPEFKKEENKPVAKEVQPEVKKEVQVEAKPAATVDLSTLKVAELRDMAKNANVKGYSTMKKSELLDALK